MVDGARVGDLLIGSVDVFCQMLKGMDVYVSEGDSGSETNAALMKSRKTTEYLEQDYRYIMHLYSGVDYGVTLDDIKTLKGFGTHDEYVYTP